MTGFCTLKQRIIFQICVAFYHHDHVIIPHVQQFIILCICLLHRNFLYRIAAVSYTHLDVYKRQDIYQMLEKIEEEAMVDIREAMEGCPTDCTEPVSYTHLDVYKRQV